MEKKSFCKFQQKKKLRGGGWVGRGRGVGGV